MYEAEGPGGARHAVKILDRAWTKDAVVAGRFAREARAASDVASPHIVRVLDGGTEDGCPYLVMELLRGQDLGARLHERRHLGLDETLGIAEELLEGLVAAHAAGIVHRDLKPENVLLAEGEGGADVVKIVDFGMSKIDRPAGSTAPLALTRKGVALGTPLYMSPEQARASADVDARSDLFSVGAILFECLTGRPPFTGETPRADPPQASARRTPRTCGAGRPRCRTRSRRSSSKALERERERQVCVRRRDAGRRACDRTRGRGRSSEGAAKGEGAGCGRGGHRVLAGALVTLLAVALAGK